MIFYIVFQLLLKKKKQFKKDPLIETTYIPFFCSFTIMNIYKVIFLGCLDPSLIGKAEYLKYLIDQLFLFQIVSQTMRLVVDKKPNVLRKKTMSRLIAGHCMSHSSAIKASFSF